MTSSLVLTGNLYGSIQHVLSTRGLNRPIYTNARPLMSCATYFLLKRITALFAGNWIISLGAFDAGPRTGQQCAWGQRLLQMAHISIPDYSTLH